jgi:hypothetical protein
LRIVEPRDSPLLNAGDGQDSTVIEPFRNLAPCLPYDCIVDRACFVRDPAGMNVAGYTSGMRRESVEQRGMAGTESAFFMAIKQDDIIYVLTKEDVDDVAKSIGLSKLTDEHYRMARKYIQSFCGDGAYSWENAISDALKEVEEERQGKHSGPESEE